MYEPVTYPIGRDLYVGRGRLVSVDGAAGEGIAGSAAADEREDAGAFALGDSLVFGFITQACHE